MKVLKRLTAVLLATVMMVSMGLSVFAAAPGNYNVSATLCKDAGGNQTSMGNNGIASVKATVKEGNLVDIEIKTKPMIFNNQEGQLDAVSLYDKAAGEEYVGTQNPGDDLTFYITNFPANEFDANKVIRGDFTSVMGKRTGYLRINAMNAIN